MISGALSLISQTRVNKEQPSANRRRRNKRVHGLQVVDSSRVNSLRLLEAHTNHTAPKVSGGGTGKGGARDANDMRALTSTTHSARALRDIETDMEERAAKVYRSPPPKNTHSKMYRALLQPVLRRLVDEGTGKGDAVSGEKGVRDVGHEGTILGSNGKRRKSGLMAVVAVDAVEKLTRLSSRELGQIGRKTVRRSSQTPVVPDQ